MENIDIQQIESYLRGKMTPTERGAFEAALDADPALRRRTEEVRQIAEGIRQAARGDIRQRVEAQRDKIKMEESGMPPNPRPGNWGKSAALLIIGIFLGLGLGWLLSHQTLTEPLKQPSRDGLLPVALSPYEPIATIYISSSQPGKNIQLAVLHDPDLEDASTPVRRYALDRGGVGMCVYTRREDNFWRQPLALLQSGPRFFLKIGAEKFLLQDDGEEHPFPEQSEKD